VRDGVVGIGMEDCIKEIEGRCCEEGGERIVEEVDVKVIEGLSLQLLATLR
jgi:hypothetical protein